MIKNNRECWTIVLSPFIYVIFIAGQISFSPMHHLPTKAIVVLVRAVLSTTLNVLSVHKYWQHEGVHMCCCGSSKVKTDSEGKNSTNRSVMDFQTKYITLSYYS